MTSDIKLRMMPAVVVEKLDFQR